MASNQVKDDSLSDSGGTLVEHSRLYVFPAVLLPNEVIKSSTSTVQKQQSGGYCNVLCILYSNQHYVQYYQHNIGDRGVGLILTLMIIQLVVTE